MRRAWFAVLGATFGVAGVAFAVWSDAIADPASATTLALWFGAAALYVVGGLGAPVGGLAWYRLVGLGHVCLGLQQAVRFARWVAAGTDGSTGLVASVAAGLGGLALVYIGVDWVRGGRHFDRSRFEDPPTNA